MRRDRQMHIAKRLLSLLETRETEMAPAANRLEVSAYTCSQRAKAERLALFRGPQLIGLSSLIPNPGDFITHDHSGVPLLFVRDETGAVQGMLNMCRHRGAKVERSQCGSGKRAFSCPYHAWRYDLTGRLLSRPRGEAFDANMPKSESSLLRTPVVEQDGMIWAAPEPGAAIDISRTLGAAADELAAYDLASYSHFDTRTLTRQMNWKLVIDTFLETYHISTLHGRTIAPIIHSDLATFDAFGPHLCMAAARRTLESLRDQPETDWDVIAKTAIVYVLFPNVVFVVQGDHIETWHVYPDGDSGDACRMYVSLYTPTPANSEKAKAYWAKNLDLLLRTVEGEDFPLAEEMDRGYRTGVQRFVVHGRNEPALAHFHHSIEAALPEHSGKGRADRIEAQENRPIRPAASLPVAERA